jgi:acyl transferase domain-containing protein/aryl carrier-like protein
MTETAPNPPVATPDYAMLFKRSLAAIDELESRLATTQRQQHEPIAIVGMACRFPGSANTPLAFWKLLQDGVDAVTEVPPERWDVNLYFDPDPNAVGKTYSRWGAFVDSVDRFDAAFFGISPREAISLDPQQRLLLEVTWEALEHAGIAPSSLAGSATAVYVGITTHDYAMRMAESVGFRNGDAYTSSGTAHSVAAGRLSYFLGVHGPNAAVDTACSSSLVALHWAIQSLRRGEANMALAGGVNLTLIPDGSILTSRARMISSDGRCKTFDASANGYVRGEGCGILALKRLSDAQRDGDTVLAVIRGSALNQDGRSSGLSAPNGLAQESVIRAALADAGLAADDIDYIEAHGTGTPLGDPIEIKALGEVFGQRPAGRALQVGSVKTNIGHLEAAAGIAGVIKTVLALQHRTIPPHLHLLQPNQLIDWARYRIEVPLRATAWQAHADAPRRAGVSSFGFSGTNSHIVLEEAPVTTAPVIAASTTAPRSELLVISAQSRAALTELASRYCGTLAAGATEPSSDGGSPDLAAVGASAALGRSHFAERLAIVAASADETYRQLAAFAASGYPSNATIYGRSTGSPPEIVFMFTGQGAQYVGMARQLFETEPVFRATLEECERVLAPLLPRPLLSVIFAESESDTLINDTAFTQPALFAVEYALTQLWRSWGIEPTVVLGHSVGEFVAACVAGVFSLEDGLRMIAARGRLMSELPRNGAMAAVFATEAEVDQVLSGYRLTVSVAATNGPQSIVISGVATDIAAILARLADEGIDSQPLAVSHGFHSPLMEPILDAFEGLVAKVRLSPPRIGMISNLTGGLVSEEVCDPHYWRRHVREPVRFAGSIATALAEGYKLFLEVGPNATLLQMARRCDGGAEAVWLGSLRKGHGDRDQLLRTLGQLYVRGARPNWRGVFGAETALPRITLPTYPFQRERYWLDYKAVVAQSAALGATRTGHPLLGGVVASPVRIFEQKLGVASSSWLADYQIHNRTLFPSGGLIEIAMAAAQEVFGVDSVSGCVLRNVVIRDALHLPAEGDVVLQVIVTPAQDGEQKIELFHRIDSPARIFADDPAGWQLHLSCTALRSEAPASAIVQTDRRRDGLAGNANGVEVSQYYEQLAVRGADYGPAFRAIEHIMCGEHEAWGKIRVPAAVTDTERLILHPALLEAAFQLACAVLPPSDELYMPVALGGYHVLREGIDSAAVHVNFDAASFEAGVFRADVALFDESGHSIAHLSGLELRRVSRAAVTHAHDGPVHADWMYEIAWPTVARLPSTRSESRGRWLVVCDSSGVGDRLADRLVKNGAQVERVRRRSDPKTDGYRIDFADAAQWRQVLEQAGVDGEVEGIVALNVIDASSRLLDDACAAGHIEPVVETLALAQAIGDSGPRVWFVSRGSQAVAGSVPEPIQAAAWGLAGVMASEAPALRVVRLDLDPAVHLDDDSLLFEAVWTPDDEDRVALRGGRRHVARLVPAPPAGVTTGASKILSNATYLITGGLGGLGLACGRWLASEGARRLVLLGRRSPSVTAEMQIAELRRDGVEVLIVQADVADSSQLAAGLAGTASDTMPLRGILHAAGVVNDALLSELDPERLDLVWAPKVRGTLNLLRSCQPAALDFLVMFSAGAALFGSPGQGNYAAANSFMDALAHVLKSQGRPAVSINWGSWSGMGMAAAVSALHRRRWAALGMEMIEPEDGVLALRDVLRADSSAQVAVLPIVRKRLPDDSSPLLRSLIGFGKAPVHASRKQAVAASSGRIFPQLASAPKAARSSLLADFLADQVASVLALGEPRSVDRHRSLMELGLDSLMAMELRNRIYSSIGAGIAVADLLLGPSIVQLSNQLLDELSFDHDPARKLVAVSEDEPAWDGGTL